MDMVRRAAEWAGLDLDDHQIRLLQRYGEWLREEAIPAGGLGPDEAGRLESRHLADSLLFAAGWRGRQPPDRLIDLGSGAGLPGIPLGVALPAARLALVERSGRRARLLRRVLRVLDVEGRFEVVEEDLSALARSAPVVVSRASLPPAALLPHLQRMVEPGGVGVVAGSREGTRAVAGYRTLEIPPTVLDRAASLLIMAP